MGRDMTASTQAYAALLVMFLVAVLIGTVIHPQARTVDAARFGHESTGLRIDVNTADAATLTLLPGIGPGIAEYIIQARQEGTVFRRADDLQTVKFIGPKLTARIGPWIAFNSDTETDDTATSETEN